MSSEQNRAMRIQQRKLQFVMQTSPRRISRPFPGSGFSGIARNSVGLEFAVTDENYPFVKYDSKTDSFTEVPYENVPWPPHVTYYRKSNHAGDIVITRFG